MELANSEQQQDFQYWLNSKLNSEEKVKRVTKLYEELHIRELTEQKISDFFEIALTYLDKVECPKDRKNQLVEFSKSLVIREH